MGQQLKKRHINGVLLFDKPIGLSSNQALQSVKRLFNANKAGHTGSLDPIASGMLPICFGEATKFSQFLLEADKRYNVMAKLGIATASGDSEGEVIAKKEVGHISLADIEKILPEFRGKIMQLPSMYSALKHHGQPLYKLARQGITVEREKREVNIFELICLGVDHDLAKFSVHCSKGTYIRSLITDIGEKLGCGAHVIELRRLSVGNYQENAMITLAQIENLAKNSDFTALDGLLLPVASMMKDWPEVLLSSDMVHYILEGHPVLIPKAPSSGLVKLKTKTGLFLGVGEIMEDGKVAPRRLVAKPI